MPNSATPATQQSDTDLSNKMFPIDLDLEMLEKQQLEPQPTQQPSFQQPQLTTANNPSFLPPARPLANNMLSATSATRYPSQPIDLEEKLTVGRRLMDMLLAGLGFAVVGGVIDGIINVVKSMVAPAGTQSAWLFVYIFGVLGLVLGWLMGTKAFDVIFGVFRTTPTENNPSNDDDGFASGIMKAIGFGLLIGIVGWLVMMMFA